jgi:hypothetical protein
MPAGLAGVQCFPVGHGNPVLLFSGLPLAWRSSTRRNLLYSDSGKLLRRFVRHAAGDLRKPEAIKDISERPK